HLRRTHEAGQRPPLSHCPRRDHIRAAQPPTRRRPLMSTTTPAPAGHSPVPAPAAVPTPLVCSPERALGSCAAPALNSDSPSSVASGPAPAPCPPTALGTSPAPRTPSGSSTPRSSTTDGLTARSTTQASARAAA